VKGQRIGDTFNLNNAFKDPSYLREKLYFELARAAGSLRREPTTRRFTGTASSWGILSEDVDGVPRKSRR
jgi:hypothetical protein